MIRIPIYTTLVGFYLFFFIKNNFFKATPFDPDMNRLKEIPAALPKSIVPPPIKATWKKYDFHSSYGIGVFITDTNSCWLGLVHAFKSFGIPFSLCTNVDSATRHSMVLVYPAVSGMYCKPDAFDKLTQYVKHGGTLLATNVYGGLNQLFGFDDILASKTNYRIKLHDAGSSLLHEFDCLEEKEISLGDSETYKEVVGTYSYLQPESTPLLTYENGQACCTQAFYPGGGKAYALGIDLGMFIIMAEDNHTYEAWRLYVNGYEPSLDVLIRIIRNMYMASDPNTVLLNTVPGGRPLTVCITHDVDFQKSINNAVQYADFEVKKHVKATYFIQTKYITDWNDIAFYDKNGMKDVAEINKMGMEIASHSVSHSRVFDRFPMGSGTEKYPDYKPFVASMITTVNGTILGELRVSKSLLQTVDTSIHVVSFRPGHLSNPWGLPQAMEAAGYEYGSDLTAANALTELPYQVMYNRGYDTEIDIFEFPITIEDEKLPRMDERIGEALEVARKMSRYGGAMVVLIHPNVLDYKLKFESMLIDSLSNKAWFGTIGEFGHWWKARNKITWNVTNDGQNKVVTVYAPMEVSDVSFSIPKGWNGEDLGNNIQQMGNKINIHKCSGEITMEFSVEN